MVGISIFCITIHQAATIGGFQLEVIYIMSMWTRVQPAYEANMWNEALNKRLGTEGIELHEMLIETENRGIAFDQLLAIREQDKWVYCDGKSTTCGAFILAMYKEAEIFGPLASSIQVKCSNKYLVASQS